MNESNFSSNLDKYVNAADQRVHGFEQVIGRLIERVESIAQSLQRIFQKGREQKETLMELKNRAQEAIAPALNPVLDRSRSASHRIASKYREDPRPFLLGAALVAGGAALLAYYWFRKDGESDFYSEGTHVTAANESWRTQSADSLTNGSSVANAS